MRLMSELCESCCKCSCSPILPSMVKSALRLFFLSRLAEEKYRIWSYLRHESEIDEPDGYYATEYWNVVHYFNDLQTVCYCCTGKRPLIKQKIDKYMDERAARIDVYNTEVNLEKLEAKPQAKVISINRRRTL